MVRSFGLLLVVGVAHRLRPGADRRLRGARPPAQTLGRRAPRAGGTGGGPRTEAQPRPQALPVTGPARRSASVPSPLAPSTSPRRRPRAGGRRLGAGHPDRDRLRRPLAGAPEPRARSSDLERAAGSDRRLRRARRQRRSPRPRPTRRRSPGWPTSSSGCSRDNGFSGENPSCLDADVCPGPALSDFLTRGGEQADQRRDRRDAGGALALRAAPGGAARPGDRRSRPRRRCSPSASAPSRWRTSRRWSTGSGRRSASPARRAGRRPGSRCSSPGCR